jgi:5'-phosphate synthase pdxT subunit
LARRWAILQKESGSRPVDGNGERGEAVGPKKIGVLALQGDFREHAEILKKLGVEPVEVRTLEDLEGIAGIIVPGGESTAIGNLMVSSGLLDAVRSFFYQGGPVWGTCAGMVLAASATTGPRQPLLGLMNALVERNGFGRQVYSFEQDLDIKGFDAPFTGVFIRAPFFEDVGPGVEVLSKVDGRVVAARGENILVTAFHPELTDDTRFHEYFLREVCGIERSQQMVDDQAQEGRPGR